MAIGTRRWGPPLTPSPGGLNRTIYGTPLPSRTRGGRREVAGVIPGLPAHALTLPRCHQPVHDTQLLVALCLQARHLAPQPREVCAGDWLACALRCTPLLAATTATAITATATTATAAAAAATASAAAAVPCGEGLAAGECARGLRVQRARGAAQRVQHGRRAEAQAQARAVGQPRACSGSGLGLGLGPELGSGPELGLEPELGLGLGSGSGSGWSER